MMILGYKLQSEGPLGRHSGMLSELLNCLSKLIHLIRDYISIIVSYVAINFPFLFFFSLEPMTKGKVNKITRLLLLTLKVQ